MNIDKENIVIAILACSAIIMIGTLLYCAFSSGIIVGLFFLSEVLFIIGGVFAGSL